MPTINEPSRRMGNGDVVTRFKDSVGTSSRNYTLKQTNQFLKVTNTGSNNISFSVGSYSDIVLEPGESWERHVGSFDNFDIQATSGNQSFEIIATATENLGNVGPVDVQGFNLAPGERVPVDRAPLTEYKQGKVVDFGTGTPFTHEVNGSKLAIGLHWETNTDWSIDIAYVVPGTTNVLMSSYETIASGTGNDGDCVVVDPVKNKYARIRINNDSADTNTTIDTVSVVDL